MSLLALIATRPLDPTSYPASLQPFEALGSTLAAALPMFARQAWRKRSGKPAIAVHHWTVVIALLLAWGNYYASTHPPR